MLRMRPLSLQQRILRPIKERSSLRPRYANAQSDQRQKNHRRMKRAPVANRLIAALRRRDRLRLLASPRGRHECCWAAEGAKAGQL